MTEYLLYGLRSGETERWTEELLKTGMKSPAEAEAIKTLAAKDGFHSFRIAKFTPGEKPDFTKALKG